MFLLLNIMYAFKHQSCMIRAMAHAKYHSIVDAITIALLIQFEFLYHFISVDGEYHI